MARPTPVSHLLNAVIRLPLNDIKLQAKALLEERLTQVTPLDVGRFVEAAVHNYFIDAHRRRMQKLEDEWDVPLQDLEDEVRGALHRLLFFSTGPLVPALRYRYSIENDDLVITPSLPTQDDILEQLENAFDPTEGWLPARYRP